MNIPWYFSMYLLYFSFIIVWNSSFNVVVKQLCDNKIQTFNYFLFKMILRFVLLFPAKL